MSDSLPLWGTVALGLVSPVGGMVAFVLGRSSRSGASAAEFKRMQEDLASHKRLFDETIITVSNHAQSIASILNRLSDLDTKMNAANNGIATLLERTNMMIQGQQGRGRGGG